MSHENGGFRQGLENIKMLAENCVNEVRNISRTTPTSANTSKECKSDSLGPGVNGLITIPPKTNPGSEAAATA